MRAENEPTVKKYSQFFSKNPYGDKIVSVTFPYLLETWYVRIIGILTPEQRKEIAHLPHPSKLEVLNDQVWGKIRTPSEPVLERAINFVSMVPDERITSAFSTTGEAIQQADEFFSASKYNDPNIENDTPLMTIMAEVKDPFELSVLAFKLHVAAELIKRGILHGDQTGARLSFGPQIPLEEAHMRVDIIDEFEDGSWIVVRCLAKNERMHEGELAFWENVTSNKMTKKVIFAFQSKLHPLDEAFVKLLQRDYAHVEEMIINI